jgi:hypothetical protein
MSVTVAPARPTPCTRTTPVKATVAGGVGEVGRGESPPQADSTTTAALRIQNFMVFVLRVGEG